MMMDVPGTWPSGHDLNTLVRRSSGYFIYASKVLKFVGILGCLCSRSTLTRLSSLVEIPGYDSCFIRMIHASFKEFLNSQERAETLYVDNLSGYLIGHPEKSLADKIFIVRLLCSVTIQILSPNF
jgi:hypothetical protein